MANDPQHCLISAAYQLICIIALGSSWSWMTASISNGNARRRTSLCRCVSRLRSQMLYFKQAGFPPTTITYQQGLLVSQKAPSRQVGRQFLSSASPHCYFERLTCLTGSFRTSCIWPEANAMADEAIGFSSFCYAAGWPKRAVC